jgi:hypothetical protein
VRVAVGEMDIVESRRDLCSSIACTGSESDGLAPPSKIAEDMGSVSMRKPRDFSPMSSAPTFTTKHETKWGKVFASG